MDREFAFIIEKLKKKSTIDAIKHKFDEFVKNPNKCKKTSEKSEKFRREGNSLMLSKNHDRKKHKEIWITYTKSIAAAPNDSEMLAKSYANRSLLLCHMRRYEECLKDIARALSIDKIQNELKLKLYCRKIQCLIALQKSIEANECLDAAEKIYSKIDIGEENKSMTCYIEKARTAVIVNQSDEAKKLKKYKMKPLLKKLKLAHTEEIGKHLVASHNIKPGEIVCVQKFYVASPNPMLSHFYCSHCLAFILTSIPCLTCSETMYCSEECRNEAWTLYHETECKLQALLNLKDEAEMFSQITLRAVLMGIKEAGGIEKIKHELKIVELEKRKNSSKLDYRFVNDFKSLLRLDHLFGKQSYNILAKISVINAAVLAAHTNILGESFNVNNMNDIFKHSLDNNFFCMATLILRVTIIMKTNFTNVKEMVEKSVDNLVGNCGVEGMESRGIALVPMTTFIKHSCNSNLRKLFTGDGKIFYFCIRPIKKNEVVTDAHFGHFTEYSHALRTSQHHLKFNICCNCEACEEKWSKFETDAQAARNFILLQSHKMCLRKILDKWIKIISDYEDDCHQFKQDIIAEILRGSEILEKLAFLENSKEVVTFVTSLCCAFDRMYGIRTKIPSDCLVN